jgi:hypothetical protein
MQGKSANMSNPTESPSRNLSTIKPLAWIWQNNRDEITYMELCQLILDGRNKELAGVLARQTFALNFYCLGPDRRVRALGLAIEQDNLDAVRLLLQHKADPNPSRKSRRNTTLLSFIHLHFITSSRVYYIITLLWR